MNINLDKELFKFEDLLQKDELESKPTQDSSTLQSSFLRLQRAFMPTFTN